MNNEDLGSTRETAVVVTAAQVRAALAWRNITGSSAARSLGMTQAYLSRRLNGDVPFNIGDIVLLAALIRVSPGRLIDGEWRPKGVDATPV